MPAQKKKPINLEATLQELNTIVEQLETGDLPLEKSLAQFEKGITLTRDCQKALKTAEQKVRLLIEQDDDEILVDYDANE